MKIFKHNKQAAYYYDYGIIIAVGTLLAIGFLLLASASMGIADKWYNSSCHFLLHQAIYLCISICLIIFIKHIPLHFWERISGYLLLGSIFLLMLVLIPGFGRTANHSTRWLRLGIISLQVSEFAKLALVIYLASYLSRRQQEVRLNFKGFIKPLILLGLISFLLILEPDFGAIVVMTLTMLGMMYLAEAPLWQFMILLLLVGLALTALAITSPYRLLRLTAFLNPWAEPFDSGYQLVQSLIAFGRGGIFGVGLGNSIQKLFYLPEVHTDFLYAVLAEEFGIIGQIAVLGMFVLLAIRAFQNGRIAAIIKNSYASYLAYGFGLLISLQAIINIGVNMGLLPTKGLTLPFMSYGGSSILFSCIAVAILLRIHHEITLKTMSTPKNYFLKPSANTKSL